MLPQWKASNDRLAQSDSYRLALAAVYANIFLVMTGLGALFPALPEIQSEFRASYAGVSWAVSAFAIARLLTNLPAGAATARYPQLPLLIGGSAAVALGSLLVAISPDLKVFLLARAVSGVGSSICTTVGLTFVLNATKPERRGRASGLFHSALAGGAFLGPGFGGLLASLVGWRGAMLGAAGAAALSTLVLSCVVRVGVPRVAIPKTRTSVVAPSSSPPGALVQYVTYLRLASGAYAAAFSIFFVRGAIQQTLIPLIAHDVVGLSTAALSMLLMGATAIASLLGPGVGALSDRIGRQRTIVPALILFAFGTILVTQSSQTAPFVVGALLTGIAGAANSLPSSMIADMVDDAHRGYAISLYRVVGDLALTVAPALSGWIADMSGFGLSGYIIASLLLLVLLLVRRDYVQQGHVAANV